MNYSGYNDSGFQGGNGVENDYGGNNNGAMNSPSKTYSNAPYINSTIKMVRESRFDQMENKIYINNKEITGVTVIGCILQTDSKPALNSYTIFDGTGSITVHEFNRSVGESNDNGEMSSLTTYPQGSYIIVSGQVKEISHDNNNDITGSSYIINSYSIRPLESTTLLYHHFLTIIHDHLHLIHNNNTNTINPDVINTNYDAIKSSAYGSSTLMNANDYTNTGMNNYAADNLTATAANVYNVFCDYKNNGINEISVDDITKVLQPSGINEQDIREAISELDDCAKIYSTSINTYKLL